MLWKKSHRFKAYKRENAKKKCPNCGRLTFYPKNSKYKLKYECKNCGYRMQVPSVEIWRDRPQDTRMDK